MNKSLYITAAGPAAGKCAIALSIMQLMGGLKGKVAFFRPIISTPEYDDKDPDIRLMLEVFKLEQNYADTFAYTEKEAYEIIATQSMTALHEGILARVQKLQNEYDFVVILGADISGKDPLFKVTLNAEIAGNLNAPVLLVVSGKDATLPELRQSIQSCMMGMSKSCDILCTIINRSSLSEDELESLRAGFSTDKGPALIYSMPEDATLGSPTLNDVARACDATFLTGEKVHDSLVANCTIAAMHADHFLSYLEKDLLIITPGDRTDILLAAAAARMSPTAPSIAGVLLSGGLTPSESVMSIIRSLDKETTPILPIMLTKHHTFRASQLVQSNIRGVIEPTDTRKINSAIGLFDSHVDCTKLTSLFAEKSSRMTPVMFEYKLLTQARKNKQRIVLCEGEEPRILQATDILLRRNAADIILLGDEEKIRTRASNVGADISKATIINPLTFPEFDDYVASYYEYRKKKGITMEYARNTMEDATYFGTMMVKKGLADGMVSGAVNTTAHTITPAFQFIKTKPGFSVVSSVFLMCLRDRVLVFGDCAVNPNPTADQLAEIAIASAHTAKVFGIEPRVAMLSYSTGSSGKGADVDVVKEATKIAKEKAPDLLIEGPLQYDAAIEPSVAKTKAPGSAVAGKATVFIFPDLNTGNNTYKAVQRAAGAIAIGPVLQGLNKPVNDLSRGCLVADIVNTVIITAIQSAAEKQV